MPTSSSSFGRRVQTVIRSACRRRVLLIAVEQLAPALSLVLSGGMLILLLGTQILNWYWLVLLGVAGLSLATARIRARLLTPYRVAQLLDRRLELSDSLSTAWFLLTGAEKATQPLFRFQIERAEEMAARVQLSRALPFTGRRAWAATGVLAGVAFGLFAVRYLVTSSLSLRQPVVSIHLAPVIERIESLLSAKNQELPTPEPGDQQPSNSAQSAPSREGRFGSQDSKSSHPKDAMSGGASSQQTPTQKADGFSDPRLGDRKDTPGVGQPNGTTATSQRSENDTNSAKASEAKEGQDSGQQSSSSLLDKMKDALSSLAAKMRRDSNSTRPTQNSETAGDDQRDANQMASSKDKTGRSRQDGSNQQSNDQQSSEAQGQGQAPEKAQASQGRNSDEAADRKTADARSGIGRQDGDKAIKEAEQLQAMGKLAEIIGKRSASLTGEMTVETPSNNQRLKTEYSQRVGHHSDLGGEINRDEIPLAYQQYVREYMERVRKDQAKSGP